jgi:hypothetical protein
MPLCLRYFTGSSPLRIMVPAFRLRLSSLIMPATCVAAGSRCDPHFRPTEPDLIAKKIGDRMQSHTRPPTVEKTATNETLCICATLTLREYDHKGMMLKGLNTLALTEANFRF